MPRLQEKAGSRSARRAHDVRS